MTEAMQTIRLTRKDFKETPDGLTIQGDYSADRSLEIEGGLGCVRFSGSLSAQGYIYAEAGTGIRAGEGIEAGWGIEAGTGIVCFRAGLRAKVVSALRIAVGFDIEAKCQIEAKVEKGEVILGTEAKPNPLLPVVYAWHIHDRRLVEPLSEPIENRVAYIKSDKPKDEQETRLRLLKPVTDQQALRKAMNRNDHEAIEALHKKECPNCPWSPEQQTIFPK
jgi:hypothetical protein